MRCLATALAAAVLTLTPLPTIAAASAPRPQYCSSAKGGLYFSPWGEATVLWEPRIRALIKKYGAVWDAVRPVSRVRGKDGEDLGIRMPIGMQYDSIGLDGRICYPGGFSLTQPGTGNHLTIDDGFAIRVLPCGAYAKPVINGVRQDKEVQLATCFAPEALVSIAGVKKGGLGGLTPWHFKASPALAEIVNRIVGEPALKAGEPLFSLAPVLKYHPF
ncbi:hypothetical protein [Acrocarpospora catenulata]|uniref:hypothetical protein n=1 Tax=Acrocarpospora catenulata TaxID=2836182 RepID=UPI001BDA5623|nr:hypothetical protein [Acrocarpospora catenulata]